MHIADGALSTNVMIATNVLAAGGVGVGLSKLDYEQVPRVGVMASVFFVATFIRISVGPTSVHLLLNGLVGFLLGWAAFPALVAALFLQAILLGFGGLTSLGANTLNMAVPAVLCHYAFAAPCRRARTPQGAFAWGAAAGAFGVMASCGLLAACLHLSSPTEYAKAVKAVLLVHLPVAVIEAGVIGAAAAFLRKVRPELLLPPVHSRGSADPSEPGVLQTPAVRGTAAMLLAVVALVGVSSEARAHSLKCFAAAEGTTVKGYGWFSRSRAKNVPVVVTSPDGRILARTKTDDQGEFSFEAKVRCDHVIRLDGGDGHVGTFTLSAADLPDGLPGLDGDSGETVAEAPPTEAAAVSSCNSPAPEKSISNAELEAMLAKVVSRQVAPLRRDLAELREKRGVQDVLGGIGYLLGAAGIAFYCLGVRRRESSD